MIAQLSTVAFFAGLAAAVHAPVGDPLGNPITAPLIEIVPACKEFTIQWTPTTPNTVSLLLLRGPSSNVVPIGAPLAEGIANSGSFKWTPSSDLEADTTHYGLQLIDDVTGQYQYSTQFGISKDACNIVSVSSTVAVVKSTVAAVPTAETSATAAGYGYGYATPAAETSSSSSSSSTKEVGYPTVPSSVPSSVPAVSSVPAPSAAPNTTFVPAPYPTAPVAIVSSAIYPLLNSTVVLATNSVPSSIRTATAAGPPSSTSEVPLESTGGASSIRAGLGLAGAVAGLVFML
ncbi:hypothetical protein K504DRAFT_489684 [Pleomassaria siparia CBS 279.74]|uniref:Yeast cell wall synthesis Kre9/Knh1-like N-terminal domain-containing protein n=1 Tax=Pleomassaria siparia CBS 279.74 TaxID=1314801 RepID=A0A6G1KHS1_9PLEO|nr:hypothetical protein K504DRAFT_489684 [Pleomassaria siparia CBS 279.74]